jgi:hypothetical protein
MTTNLTGASNEIKIGMMSHAAGSTKSPLSRVM